MPFQIFDKIEDIPEAQRDVYEEKDGKWHAKVPDVTNLNSALDKERTGRETEEKARKKAEKDLADLRRKATAAESNISEEQLEKLRKEDDDKRKPIQEELDKTKAELTKVKKTDRVQRLFLDSGGMPDRVEDAMLALDRRTGLTEDGNTITVLDKDGKLTTEKVEDFVKASFKKEKPWLYAGSGGSGSGAGGSSRTGSPLDETPPGEQERITATKRAQVSGAF
jgi:hypothetical protein